jgi:uncharacterized repeat protein (TIGR04076 family)
MPTCKITVIKRALYPELAETYLGDSRAGLERCQVYSDGQTFIIEDFPTKPEGFCDWAWADIHREVVAVMFGASYPWMKEPGSAISCCTDGLRPVVFLVEKIA